MAFEVVMPKWGLTMQEGLIVQWLKQEGESVEKDEPLLEVETEKMVSVVEAPASGILARILQPAESRVPVSQAIALITAPGEPAADLPASPELPADDAHAPTPTPSAPVSSAPSGVVPAMPAARRLARDHGARDILLTSYLNLWRLEKAQGNEQRARSYRRLARRIRRSLPKDTPALRGYDHLLDAL